MTTVKISGATASAAEREVYTSGTVGATLRFEFDGAWDGLAKTAVFRFGSVTYDVPESEWTDGECVIPHECLAASGDELMCGVYGVSQDGKTVIPTVWVRLGYVQSGVDPSGDESTAPTLPIWAALKNAIGDLGDLDTTAKNTLVAAINEAAQSGAPGKDGAPGAKGDKGDKGADGKTPIKGTDYWTASDKQEIIDDIQPVFYIDLEGNYGNYQCPVSLEDIKAAYEAEKNLYCRCTLGKYTATLPLFVPIPLANTWIFSGSGALSDMGFIAQAFTVAISSTGVKAENARLALESDIPLALPNPEALTIKIGDISVEYNGSEAKTVTIADGSEVAY